MAPNTHDDLEDEPAYTVTQEKLTTNLDPELQQVVLELRSKPSEAADQPVDVIAVLHNPDGEIPEELKDSHQTGPVVTGKVAAGRVETVRSHPNVLSLKSARRVYPTLNNSVPEIRATPALLRTAVPDKNLGGDGVIVGIVDHGGDFFHPNFRKADDTTRLLYIWDQHGTRGPAPDGFADGTEFSADEINQALKQPTADEAYKQLGYTPRSNAHGTRVMDMAAGGGAVIDLPDDDTIINPAGVAPRADIIFVDVAQDDVPLEEPSGNSRHLLDAVKYIFKKADELSESSGVHRPAVVNISLSSDSGPHDGSNPFELGIDYLLQTPGRAVVIAAGNSRGQRIHASLLLQPGQEQTLFWEIRPDDKTDNKVELWYDGLHAVEVSLISPHGHRLPNPFPPNTTHTIDGDDGSTARVFHRQHDPNNRDNQVLIIFSKMEPGSWGIALRPLTFTTFEVHAWIENDSSPHSRFSEEQRDNSYTIGSIACGHSSIAVGAYHSLDRQSLLDTSSEGPTRDGRKKPEVSAPGATVPGRGVFAAFAGTPTSEFPNNGGTSAAAPHVAGLIALLMQNAGHPLTIAETRALLFDSARKRPTAERVAWHPRYGVGRVDVAAAVALQSPTVESHTTAEVSVLEVSADVPASRPQGDALTDTSSAASAAHAGDARPRAALSSLEVMTVAKTLTIVEGNSSAGGETDP